MLTLITVFHCRMHGELIYFSVVLAQKQYHVTVSSSDLFIYFVVFSCKCGEAREGKMRCTVEREKERKDTSACHFSPL